MSFLGWLTGTDKYGAAQSALIAKHTFTQLTEESKKFVETTAHWVLAVGGIPRDEIEGTMAKLREDERYCLYSMAMAAVGIRPGLESVLYKDQWYPIKNPFSALINAEKQIRAARFEIKRKHNIDIDLTFH